MKSQENQKLAISAWVWTSNPEENNYEFISKASLLGYQGVEIPTLTGVLDKVGLMETLSSLSNHVTPIIVGSGSELNDFTSESYGTRKNAQNYVKKLIDISEHVGSTLICGPLYSPVGKLVQISENERKKLVSRVASALGELSGLLEDTGINIALEPLCRYDTFLINTAEQVGELIEQIGSSNFGILLDTFHMNIEEESLSRAFEITADKTFHIQVCENNRGIPGTGQINWQEFKNSLRNIKYNKFVSVESFTPYDIRFSEMMKMWRKFSKTQDLFASQSFTFLRKLFDE